jgi:O-antigen/teichoic acid export membrane protein
MKIEQQHIENRNELLSNIKERIGTPINKMVVLTAIESFGIRDKDTKDDFGIVNILDLAELIYKELVTNPDHIGAKNAKQKIVDSQNKNQVKYSDYNKIQLSFFVKSFFLGIFNISHILFQFITIIIFGYSMWTSVEFNNLQSTAVVLGVILGMIISGGFVQVIGRQASFYWSYNDFKMTKKIIDYSLKKGTIAILLMLSVLFILNIFFNLYPIEVLYIIFVYALLIGLLILYIAPLYPIKQRWFITVVILIGSITSLILVNTTSLLIFYTHWIGLVLVIVLCKLFLVVFFNKIIKKSISISKEEINTPVLLYHNFNYFFYGLFIYLFVFTDRILAWSSEINGQLPFIIYFKKDYELGMDIAVISFLFLGGVLEYSIKVFTHFLDIEQRLKSYTEMLKFNAYFKKTYWRNIIILLISSAILFTITHILMTASWGYESKFHEKLLGLSFNVAYYGCIGYLFLAWGMLNSLYLFTLGKPLLPLKAIVIGTLVNILIGFILSRFIAFEYSVIGMVAGAVVFMFITLREVVKFMNNLAYNYYSSY